MGKELRRAFCPPKYCKQGSVFAESLPTLVALVIVAFFSGSLFQAGGVNFAITVVIEILFAGLMYGFFFLFFRGMKKRLGETYISVCENGVCGVCPVNGFKNREFSLLYSQIDTITAKGERLIINAKEGNVVLTLENAPGICSLIQAKKNGS